MRNPRPIATMHLRPGFAMRCWMLVGRMTIALVGTAIIVSSIGALAPRSVSARERGVVFGTVRGERDEPLSEVRVRITAPNVEATVRTGARGTFSVSLPVGTIHFVLTHIGYAPHEVDVTVISTTNFQVRMQRLPQQLGAVNVREDWIGIRGIVGDYATTDGLKGVTIKSMKRSINVVTDSPGRFEFSLPKRERTSLTLSHSEYLTKPFVVPMDSTNSADIVVLLNRGADPIFKKQAMVDLEHRMAWGGSGMFVLDNKALTDSGEQYVSSAIVRSSMLVRKGIFLSRPGVFLDGQPSSLRVLQTIKVADVEMVEVWGQDTDDTRTLASRWPGGGSSHRGGGPWIAVWRKR